MALLISAVLASGDNMPVVAAEIDWTGSELKYALDQHLEQGCVSALLLQDKFIMDWQTLKECGVVLDCSSETTTVAVTAVVSDVKIPEYKYTHAHSKNVVKVETTPGHIYGFEFACVYFSDGTSLNLRAPKVKGKWRTLPVVEKQWKALFTDLKRWGFVNNVPQIHSHLKPYPGNVVWLPVEHVSVRKRAREHSVGRFCSDDVVVYTGLAARHSGKDLIGGTVGTALAGQDDRLEVDVHFPTFGKCRCAVQDLQLSEGVFVHSRCLH